VSYSSRQESGASDQVVAALSNMLNMTVGLTMVALVAKSIKYLVGVGDVLWRLERDERDLKEYIEKFKKSPSLLTIGMTAEVMSSLETGYRELAENKELSDLASVFKDMEALAHDAYWIFEQAEKSGITLLGYIMAGRETRL
jgi:hypothetical protein